MSQDQIDILKRALAREKQARKQAEKILEDKSAVLYQTTQELKKSNAQLEGLIKEKTSELKGVFENIIDPYVVMDLWGNVIKMNDAAVDLFGYNSLEERFNLLEISDDSEKENVTKSFQLLLEKGSITNFEAQIVTKNRGQKLVHVNASLIYDENNKPTAAQGIVRDITKEREAEEQIIQSENRLSTLVLNLESGVLLEDENHKIVLANKRMCELFNIAVAPELLKGEDCSQAAEEYKNLFKQPQKFVERIYELVAEKKVAIADELIMIDGRILERDFIPIYKNKIYKGSLWTYRDVSLKRQYRKSLEAQKQKYSGIIANMNLGLLEVDNEDKILMVNQSFEKMSGYSEDELLGKKASETFLLQESAEVIKKETEKRKKGKSNSYELEIKDKSGQHCHWLISGAPNYNLKGEIIGSIGIHLDITQQKSLELQKESLLAELGKSNDELQEYAHIVSHDLKSPLRSINALVTWIKEDNQGKLDEVSLQNFSHIEATLEKMEQLISDILNYSSVGSDTAEKQDVDTNDLVEGLTKILYIPEHISLELKNKLPIISGDKTKLQQLFQNLISNAVKFIDKEKGLIEIDVVDKKSFYQFSIKDNGIGIEPRYHDKIFKIFHSLNKSKESTGIGLSIVKKIVDLHEGNIWLESVPGIGTTFFFTLKK